MDGQFDAIPILRDDSGASAESADSPFGSALNTPADEQPLHFDSVDGKLLSAAAQTIQPNHGYGEVGISGMRSPRRISLSRQFSKALKEANKSRDIQSEPFLAVFNRSASERVYHGAPDSPNLLSFATPEMPSMPALVEIEAPRTVTPEPRVSDIYDTSSPQVIVRTTPLARPPLRRDIFSPATNPIPFVTEGVSVDSVEEFTPRAHSTLRHRKGIYTLPNESIEPVAAQVEFPKISEKPAPAPDVDEDENFEIEEPYFPQITPLLPLQLVVFPIWCALVGAVILLFPAHLNAIAFPSSAAAPRDSHTILAGAHALAHSLVVHCLPFTAPPTPIRVFAHWATVAHLHVVIFVGVLGALTYMYPPLGALLVAACAVRCVQGDAWGSFVPAWAEEEELGIDVRQMLYRVLMGYGAGGLEDGEKVRRVGDKFFLVRKPKKEETREEILRAGGVEDEDGLLSDEE